ncbi:translocation/assembly module TamB domain-containing protein [Leptotrichia sp. HSP-536]|uniref:Translocation/assembly module TamB domain-containing protein n=1 Tax=Leptotrichia alba TaxID=3239304 RepID=A0AB39V697_9FUSO
MKYIKKSLIVFIFLLISLFVLKFYISTKNFKSVLTSILKSNGLNVEFNGVWLIGFSKIQINNLKVKDMKGKVVVYGKKTTAGISLLMPTRLNRIDIYNGVVNLERRKNNDFNIFHVIKKDPKKRETFDPTSRIGKLHIHNGVLNYTDISFPKKIQKKLVKVSGNLETAKSRGFSLVAKGSGNKNQDGTIEQIKVELKQLVKSKQSIYSMFDTMKNSDKRRKEFRLNFSFGNIGIREELGQYVPLDMIKAKGGILNGVLKLSEDKVKKKMNVLGNLKIKNGKLSYVDFDGDIENVNAVIDLKKEKITVKADTKLSEQPVSLSLDYIPEKNKLNLKLNASNVPFEEIARYKVIKDTKFTATGGITGNLDVNVDIKSKKATLDGKFSSDNIGISNYNFQNVKTAMKIADNKVTLDNTTFVFNEEFSGFRINQDVKIGKFVYDLKNKNGSGNYVLKNLGSDFDIKTFTGNAKISSKNVVTGTLNSRLINARYTVNPTKQTVVINARSKGYLKVNYGGNRYVVSPDIENLVVKFNETNVLRSGRLRLKLKDLSVPFIKTIRTNIKIHNGNYRVIGTAGTKGGTVVNINGTTTSDMKHSYTLNIPKTTDIAHELRVNGYSFKGLNKAKIPATATARINGSGSHFSGKYELFSPYGEYIGEYEKLRVNGKINDLTNLDLTVNTNMNELWFGYQRLKNVKANLNIKNNAINILNIQNENLSANGKFDIKTGKMNINAKLKDYMLYDTSSQKLNLNVGVLTANLSGTVDKLSGTISLPAAPTTIKSNYIGDTNAFLKIKNGVIDFQNVTLRDNKLFGTYDLKTGLSDIKLSLNEPDIPKLLNVSDLTFGTKSNLSLKGDLNNFNLSGDLALKNMSLKTYKLPQITANVEYSNGNIDKLFKYGIFDIQKLKFFGDNNEVLFETHTKFDLANVNIDYKLANQKFSLDSVQDLKDKGYSGDVDLSFMYRGSFEKFITGLQIKSDNITLSGFPVKSVDIDLQANEKTLNIGQFYVEYEDNPLLVNGYFQFAPIKYNVSMLAKNFNLDFLGVNKDVKQASGIANIDAIFSNEFTTGHILLDNFNYKTKDKLTLVDNINANIDLKNNKLIVNRLDGGYNGGTFKVTGNLDVPTIPQDFMKTKRLELGKIELNAALNKVGIHYGKGIDLAVSGNAVFTENKLLGDLIIDSAEIRELPDFNSKSETASLSEEEQAKKAKDKTIVEGIVEEVIDKILKQYSVKLNVQTGNNVKLNIPNISIVRNIKGRIKGDSEITYNDSQIGIDGEYTITKGSFSANGNDFKIDGAEIRFVPTINGMTNSISNPFVIFDASTIVNGDRIEINVSGNVNDPKISFSSSSGKTREEIISMLAFNTVLGDGKKDDKSSDGAIITSSLINSALNELIFSSVTGKIRDVLGMSKVSVSTNVNSSKDGGYSASTTLSLQDNLYKDKLFWNVALKFPYQTSKAEGKEPISYNAWLGYNVTNGLDLRLGGENINKSKVYMTNGSRINYYFGIDFSTRADTFGDILKKIFRSKKLDTLEK